ncbi:MAG: glutamine--fructose-6-phosphate transaminase (isomerizing) [Candidatus Caenarcaniphilales bacterium]|nr:glutamine--fructose-6-phosphate transaminase (isomerizing) [Candidatus Caenarcaniphilales bacterium]
MCGIVGYVGKENALDYLIKSLKVLEYRGYDSSGIAITSPGKEIKIVKSKGKLANLIELTKNKEIKGNIGIGHTRWATQGIPSDINAHPHSNGNSSVAIVHNGIISNYLELKEELVAKNNIKFSSDTDSEVVAHLIGVFLEEGKSLKDALIEVIKKIKGSYALSIISKNEPSKILLTCHDAPLVIGIGKDNDLFCASDSSALLQYTDQIVRLKDNQIAELGENGKLTIYDLKERKVVDPNIQTLKLDPVLMDKGEFKHFLMKEIHEQPNILRKLLSNHLDADLKINFPSLDAKILSDIDRIIVIGCGTAFYAGIIGKILLETFVKLPTEIEFASELLSRPILANEKTLIIAISQSGETADTLIAVKSALEKGAKLLAITNRPESSLANLAEKSTILLEAGIEVSVAATKSFTSQIMCMYLFSLFFADYLSENKKIKVDRNELDWIKQELRYIPQVLEQVLAREETYREKILPFANKAAFIFLGRGLSYPIALEGALKLKELTYIHATGYASGEMKHGPIATIDENVPTLSILPPGPTYHKALHNLIEAKTRGAPSIAILADGDSEASKEATVILSVPSLPFSSEYPHLQDLFSPFINVIPLQLIAYYLAEYLGKDVDQPRNLAKSVTVEF